MYLQGKVEPEEVLEQDGVAAGRVEDADSMERSTMRRSTVMADGCREDLHGAGGVQSPQHQRQSHQVIPGARILWMVR